MDAYATLLGSGLARLRHLYAARIAAALLCRRGNIEGLIAALLSERDAAIDQLRISLLVERKERLGQNRQPKRYRYQPSAQRPDRKERGVRPFRPQPG